MFSTLTHTHTHTHTLLILLFSHARSLEDIPDSVLPHFQDAAEQLIKEKGATNVVAAALAYISGAKEIISRSLLSAHQVRTWT